MVLNGSKVRVVFAASGAFLVVPALATLGWVVMGAARGVSPNAGVLPAWQTPSVTAEPTTTTAPLATTPAATRTPTPKPTTKKPTAKPTPSVKPPRASLPPPPNPPSTVTAGPDCPSYTGPNAERSEVKAALVTAAGRAYWDNVPQDDYPIGLTGPMPHITVPVNLMKAIAWQESGWQSAIKACDGGLGVMQITPSPPGVIGTDRQMNNRFHTSYDVNTLSGNAALGAEYLEWLTMYFGLYYFGRFDLAATAPVGVGGEMMLLRDVVISAYNMGPGGVENPDRTTLTIRNQRYVDNVTALIFECVCLSF